MARTSCSEVTCVNCGDPLNVRAKELPFTVRDDGGEGGGKAEAWCPQCFVHHRAPLEPERFQPHRPHIGRGGYRAIKCANAKCGMTTVDPGVGFCLQCRGRIVLELPPKPHAGVLGWKPEVKRTVGIVRKRAS